MDIYEYEVDFEKAFDICNIIERITGREIHHGETHYNYDEVFEQMKVNAELVDEIIATGSEDGEYEACAAGSNMDPDDPNTRWDFAVTIVECSFLFATE